MTKILAPDNPLESDDFVQEDQDDDEDDDLDLDDDFPLGRTR